MKNTLKIIVILGTLTFAGCTLNVEDKNPIKADFNIESGSTEGTEDPDCRDGECEG